MSSRALLFGTFLELASGCRSDYGVNKNVPGHDLDGDTAADTSSPDTGDTVDRSNLVSDLVAKCIGLDETACPDNQEQGSSDEHCVRVNQSEKSELIAMIEEAAQEELGDEGITIDDILGGGLDLPATVFAEHYFNISSRGAIPAWVKDAQIHFSFGNHEDEYEDFYREAWPFEIPPLKTITCIATAYSYDVEQSEENAELINSGVYNYFHPEDLSFRSGPYIDDESVLPGGKIIISEIPYEPSDSNFDFSTTQNALDENANPIIDTAWVLTGQPSAGAVFNTTIIQY